MHSSLIGNKHSLTMFDGHEDLQAGITNNAFLFAQLTMEEAKRSRLTREQVIKEGCHDTNGRTARRFSR